MTYRETIALLSAPIYSAMMMEWKNQTKQYPSEESGVPEGIRLCAVLEAKLLYATVVKHTPREF